MADYNGALRTNVRPMPVSPGLLDTVLAGVASAENADSAMRAAVDRLAREVAHYSWVGIYVLKDDELVLTLEVRTSNTTRQLRNFLAYSVLEGRLQQTLVQTVGEYDESLVGFDATFTLGSHAIAEEMRRLGMVATPVGRLYSPKAQGVLPGPSAVPFISVPAMVPPTQ